MASLIQDIRVAVERALVAAFGPEMAGTDPMLVAASNPKFGDFQANVAMSLAKQLGKKPREIAEAIVAQLDVSGICEDPSIAGPGFINLMLKRSVVSAQIRAMQGDERLGVAKVAQPLRIVIDYPSPNIAKEMHVGHLRPAVIGECLARILEFLGHDVLKISHLGDWGTPFGMQIAYLRESYPDYLVATESLNLGDLASFYKQAKARFDADEGFKEAARQAVVALQAGDTETLRAWEVVCELSRRSYRKMYDLLGVATDIVDRGESFYNPFLADVVRDLQAAGLLEENQGAQCVFLEGFSNKEGEPLPLIVRKSDGGYNYATTDLAAIRHRIGVEKADRLVYTTDVGQTNHFAQVFQVVKRAGWVPKGVELVHAPFGLVLGKGGKKFSTRAGDAVPLRELLDEAIDRARTDLQTRLAEDERVESEAFIENAARVIGLGSVKYSDLSQNRTSNYVFDYDRMLDLKGNTAPYLLYVYARVQSIGRKGGVTMSELSQVGELSLEEEAELVLAKHLLQFGEVLGQVSMDLLPNRLCQFLFELSQKYNKFFEDCPVLKAEEPQRSSRLVLCDVTARTIEVGLRLLGMEVLERM